MAGHSDRIHQQVGEQELIVSAVQVVRDDLTGTAMAGVPSRSGYADMVVRYEGDTNESGALTTTRLRQRVSVRQSVALASALYGDLLRNLAD